MKIGILALQGAFREHGRMLNNCGAETVELRRPEHLAGIDGIVIPGGESTTIGKLLITYELMEPIKQLGEQGIPILGTCAGLVLLAKDIVGSSQPSLGLMDIRVMRNAFGRQVDSFEVEQEIEGMEGHPFRMVFIRAPYIVGVGAGVEVLAEYQDKVVMARQRHCLVSSFHPELTEDQRVHQLFLSMVQNRV